MAVESLAVSKVTQVSLPLQSTQYSTTYIHTRADHNAGYTHTLHINIQMYVSMHTCTHTMYNVYVPVRLLIPFHMSVMTWKRDRWWVGLQLASTRDIETDTSCTAKQICIVKKVAQEKKVQAMSTLEKEGGREGLVPLGVGDYVMCTEGLNNL